LLAIRAAAIVAATLVVLGSMPAGASADSSPTAPSDVQQAIEQARIDAAMNRLREKQQTRTPSTAPATAPSHANQQAAVAPVTQPSTQPAQPAQATGPVEPYSRDIVAQPLEATGGMMPVPLDGPGIGVTLDRAFLDEVTEARETVRR